MAIHQVGAVGEIIIYIDGGQAEAYIDLEVIEDGSPNESVVNTLCLVNDDGEWFIHDFFDSEKSGNICTSIK